MTDRALIVEDDALTRTFLSRALQAAALTAVDARTGGEALEMVGTDPTLALVLIDGILPDMHGTALARRLLEGPAAATLPLLFVTGALRHPVAGRAGVAAVVKPVRIAALVAQVAELRDWRLAGGSPAMDRLEALAALEEMFLVGP